MEQANSQSRKFAVVSESEAKSIPYPIVFVNDDGSVREPHQSERTYLETPFEPMDSGRPYVKNSYGKKDGWGNIGGFCFRTQIPEGITILEAPLEDPLANAEREFWEKQFKRAKEKGIEVIKGDDGTITFRRPRQK